MSQPHQPYPPPRAYSPLQQSNSPQGGAFPLDPKRPAFSPTAQSPYGSPGPSNIGLPNQVFSSPYYGGQSNGTPHGSSYQVAHPYPQHNQHPSYNSLNNVPPLPSPMAPPHQVSQSGSMGPPSRPAEKPADRATDINDLGDVLSGSGIDLREEEAAMYRSYGTDQQPRPYPFPRDNVYSSHTPGNRENFYGAGSFSQPAAPYQTPEALAEAERARAVRRKAEIRQYHLSQPFLLTGNLRRRFEAERAKSHVRFDDSQWLVPRGPKNIPQQFHMQGPDGNVVVRTLQDPTILTKDSALVEILSLISLATEERLRVLIEEAALFARTRKTGSLGLLPPELSEDVAGEEVPNGLPTPSNSATSPKAALLKRSYSEMNKPLTPDSSDSRNLSTPLNPIAKALQDNTKKARTVEEERLAKRQKRKTSSNGDAGSGDQGASGGALGEVAPEIDTKKPGPKKAKAQADNASQVQQFAALNKTTQMALGGKKLSWMTKGADTGPSNPYLARPGANAQKPAGSQGPGSLIPRSRVFGEFREDKDGGTGIQVRDLLYALEDFGKEERTLQKAYSKHNI